MGCHNFDAAFGLMSKAVKTGIFPGAALGIGYSGGVYRTGVAGNRCLEPELLPVLPDTLFDLASLTKVIATTTLFLLFQEKGIISALDNVSSYIEGFSDGWKRHITLKNLLTHTSGLPAYVRLDRLCSDRSDVIRYLSDIPGECNPGERVIYSCLGYILLGAVLEKTGEDRLDNLCKKHIFEPLGMYNTLFNPISANVAATEYEENSGRMLMGSCHDENARFLGGVSGNAGLFSDIGDLAIFASMLANRGVCAGKQFLSEASFAAMIRNYTGHLNEDRGLGWSIKGHRLNDIDIKAVSAGDLLPPASFGHTGFTGTSLWVDPDNDIYAVLLANRVHPTRDNTAIMSFRPLLYNTVAAERSM